MTAAKLIESIGLLLDIAGVIVLALGLMIDRKTGATDLPTVKDRLRQSQNAEIGLALMVFGFIGQLVAIWIS